MVKEDVPAVSPIVNKRFEDCLPCRLVSGFGVIGIGLYLAKQGTKQPTKFYQYTLYSLAAASVGIGTARLLDILPKNDK